MFQVSNVETWKRNLLKCGVYFLNEIVFFNGCHLDVKLTIEDQNFDDIGEYTKNYWHWPIFFPVGPQLQNPGCSTVDPLQLLQLDGVMISVIK